MTSGFELTSMILTSCDSVQLQPVPNMALTLPLNCGYRMFLGRVEVGSRIGYTKNQ